MQALKNMLYPKEQEGKLAMLEGTNILYVVWEVQHDNKMVVLVELDRPADGTQITVNYMEQEVSLLEPLEVVEHVTRWE